MNVGRDHLLAGVCPICGHAFDAHASVDSDEAPQPGDFTVCIKCAGWLKFGVDLKLCQLAAADILSMEPETHTQLRRISRAVRAVQRQTPLCLPPRPKR